LEIPVGEAYVAREVVYVRPKDKDPYYEVRVNGFRDGPGGIIESQRITRGFNTDDLILTTPNDLDLSKELGLSGATIDGVCYIAIDSTDLTP